MSDRQPARPSVSVVIPTHDRADRLAGLVHALEEQLVPAPFEVVFVDDASSDGTAQEMDRLAAVSPIPIRTLRLSQRRGPAAARNAGWRSSSGDLVAFVDDDCVPSPGWLHALVEASASADLVQGRTMPNEADATGNGIFERTMNVAGENGFYETCNMLYRRSILEAVDGFNEEFIYAYGEDVDLGWRAIEAGARTVFAPTALVRHEVRYLGLRAFFRESARLDGAVLAVKLHPQLRKMLNRRLFYREAHPLALLATGGIVALTLPASWIGKTLIGAAAICPYAWYRGAVAPLGAPGHRRLQHVPIGLLADLVEIGRLVRSSARHRTLVL